MPEPKEILSGVQVFVNPRLPPGTIVLYSIVPNPITGFPELGDAARVINVETEN